MAHVLHFCTGFSTLFLLFLVRDALYCLLILAGPFLIGVLLINSSHVCVSLSVCQFSIKAHFIKILTPLKHFISSARLKKSSMLLQMLAFPLLFALLLAALKIMQSL